MITAESGEIVRINASAAIDARGSSPGPVSLILRRSASWTDPWPMGGEILAFGTPADIDHTQIAKTATRVIDANDSAILPGLVNAHTHLDLTHIGHIPHDPDGGFVGFVNAVRAGRMHDADAISDAVRLGIRKSLAGGTVAVGDILGAPKGDDPQQLVPAIEELLASPLAGVIYLEYFDLSAADPASASQPASPSYRRAEQILRTFSAGQTGKARLRLGIQPHAPYSVHLAGYRRGRSLAAELGLRVATHLAESPEEREFVACASGLQREMLETIGVWHDALLDEFGKQQTSIQKFAEAWRQNNAATTEPPILAAHANDTSDADLELLRQLGVTIVYCPRSSAYFAADQHFGPHRYRDMLAKGINVCLGTDSVLNLPPSDNQRDNQGFGVFDEMRFLFRRDAAEPADLIAMGTIRGAEALGLDQQAFIWPTKPGNDLNHQISGVLAVPLPTVPSTRPANLVYHIYDTNSPPRLL